MIAENEKRESKKRRRAALIPYDYEAAYQEMLDKLSEAGIRKLLDAGKLKSIYATKEIRAGEQLEVEIYPQFTKAQKQEIPLEGLKKKNPKAQRDLNERNSRKQCERIINANFDDGDIWATFTYTDENKPLSMQVAKKNMQRYIARLNYWRKKKALPPAKYVYVIECSSKGRWHHHIVMDGELDMDSVERLWTLGRRNEVRRLKKDENGLVGMAVYITKPKAQEGKYQKSWTPSKGLKKPEEKVTHYKFKQKDVEEVVRGKESMEDKLEKWYGEEGYLFTSCEIRYNSHNMRFYLYARMRKQEQKEKKKKTEKSKDTGKAKEGKSKVGKAQDTTKTKKRAVPVVDRRHGKAPDKTESQMLVPNVSILKEGRKKKI